MMNDFQMMIEFEQQLKQNPNHIRNEQFRHDALTANRQRRQLILIDADRGRFIGS